MHHVGAPVFDEGLDIGRPGRQVGSERVVGQSFEPGDDALGIQFGSRPAGVGVRVGEERLDRCFAESVIATGYDLV